MPSNNLGCGPLTVKYLMFLFNVVFFFSGLILIVIGGIAQGFFRQYLVFFENQYATPAVALLVIGVIILIVSFFGCCGASKENIFMLKLFSCLMILILTCEIIAGIAVVAMKSDVETEVQNNMKLSLNQYNDSNALVTQAWDDLQMTYHCCGAWNYTDWYNATIWSVKHKDTVPQSCCVKVYEGCGTQPSDIYASGCYDALYKAAENNIAAICGGVLVLGLVQIIGIWMSYCLVSAVRDRYEIL